MRVTDQQIYRLANLRIGNARAESVAAGEQVDTQLRVAHPWDDAGAAGLIARHAQDQARQKAVSDTAGQASEELGVVDSTMDQVTTSLARAHELAVQLASDTYNASDRANGAVEAQQLLASVISQLNQRFGDRYIFGGMLDNAPPFDAAGNYAGDGNVRQVEIAPGLLQDASLRSDVVFKGAGGGVDVLTALSSLATALAANDATQIRASVQTLSDGLHQVSDARSHAGALMSVFDLAASTAKTFSEDAQDARSRLEDADIFEASTRLAAAQQSLQATMAAAAQQFQLSLVDKF